MEGQVQKRQDQSSRVQQLLQNVTPSILQVLRHQRLCKIENALDENTMEHVAAMPLRRQPLPATSTSPDPNFAIVVLAVRLLTAMVL